LKLRRAIERVYDATARWEDGAIAVAPSVAAQLRAHRYPGTIWVVPNGLNPAWGGGWRAEPRTPGKTLRIGFFGRLAEEKGLPFLLDALRGLDGYDWHLDVIGDGHARDAVEHAIAQGGLQGRVTLHGAVSPADVPARMAGAHIVVLPSYEEGHPYVALEASRLGLPIVATSVGGIPEVVRDGENGLLVRPGDVPALTRAMRRLLEEDDLLDHLRRGAAATGDAYTSIHMTARIVAVYREILARRRRSDAAEGGGDSS
jgi:glycosyltransferase involved in cell wall biosynthesis